jgi:hypothetical protein
LPSWCSQKKKEGFVVVIVSSIVLNTGGRGAGIFQHREGEEERMRPPTLLRTRRVRVVVIFVCEGVPHREQQMR